MGHFIFIVIAAFIASVLVIALVTRGTLVVTSEVIIDRSLDIVYDYIRQLLHQERYNVWLMQDRDIKLQYTGTDGTVGFLVSWQSKSKSGDGEQEIIKVTEGEGYESEIRFKNHRNTTHAKVSALYVSDHKTKVVTTLTSSPSFPMNIMSPMIKRMIQKDMDTNAAYLKKNLEA
jgi:hypothetical protein